VKPTVIGGGLGSRLEVRSSRATTYQKRLFPVPKCLPSARLPIFKSEQYLRGSGAQGLSSEPRHGQAGKLRALDGGTGRPHNLFSIYS